MTAGLTTEPFEGTLGERLDVPPSPGVTLYWLGQAGFVVDAGGYRMLIDPYLSDTLAEKYRNARFSHDRLMPAPISPDALGSVDLVLVTHQHTDHMDPGTLSPLARLHSRLVFVVPRASLSEARRRIGVDDDRLVALDAGEQAEPLPGLLVHAVRAAHETLERDQAGHHRFLGYALSADGVTILHTGDTVPFEGQVEEIAALGVDLALMPVNGRSEMLRQAGFAGNLTVGEAIALGASAGVGALLAHHYGLFAFNTADPAEIDAAARQASLPVQRARLQIAYHLLKG